MSSKIGYVKVLDNGKYLLRLSLGFDEFGKRRQPSKVVEAKSDRDAEKQLMSFYNEREKLMKEKAVHVPATLSELHNEWVENHVKPSLRDSTADFYNNLWEYHLKKYEKAKLKTFSSKMVNKILKAEDIARSARTCKGAYRMLSAMFNWGIVQRYVTDNPCKYVDVPKYKAKKKVVYTEKEIQYIINIIKNERSEFQAIFYFAVLCGMRREEIIGLFWSDIDFDKKIFKISHVAICTKGKGTYIDYNTKNLSSERTLQLPDMLMPILYKIRAEQAEKRLKLGDKWHEYGYIFTKFNGELMGIRTPDQWLTRMKKQYPDFPNKDLHTLRHTFATYLLINGASIPAVSGALGHAQQSTTMNIYSSVIQEARISAIEMQEKLISDIKNKPKKQSVQ